MQTWFRLPLPARFAIMVVAWLGYLFVVLRLNTPDSAHRIAIGAGIASVVGAAATVGADLRMHHKFDSVQQYTAYRQALRTGKAPVGVELDHWLRWVRGIRASIGVTTLWGRASRDVRVGVECRQSVGIPLGASRGVHAAICVRLRGRVRDGRQDEAPGGGDQTAPNCAEPGGGNTDRRKVH